MEVLYTNENKEGRGKATLSKLSIFPLGGQFVPWMTEGPVSILCLKAHFKS